jgi:lipoprotein NlpI
MSGVVTTTTVISVLYTLYKAHPYIPYRLLWDYLIVPSVSKLMSKRNENNQSDDWDSDYELYEVVDERVGDVKVTTRYFIYKKEPQYTWIESESNEPVWL